MKLKKLKITNIDKFDYTLIDNENRQYIINIEFYGIESYPEINDTIYISEKMLEESNGYSFGVIGSKYSKNTDVDESEIIKIVSDNKEYYLQRYYG